jgi:hypothetical protein
MGLQKWIGKISLMFSCPFSRHRSVQEINLPEMEYAPTFVG